MPIQTTNSVEYKIIRTRIDNSVGSAVLTVATGFEGVDGFKELNTFDVEIPANEFSVIAATFYGQIKSTLYQYLIDKGITTGVII